MLTGAHRRAITPQWRDYVISHDKRIAEMTGQPFGEQYFEGLLHKNGTVLDSEPPTTAILAAEEIGGKGIEMLVLLQKSHYVDGKVISDPVQLTELATSLDVSTTLFKET